MLSIQHISSGFILVCGLYTLTHRPMDNSNFKEQDVADQRPCMFSFKDFNFMYALNSVDAYMHTTILKFESDLLIIVGLKWTLF